MCLHVFSACHLSGSCSIPIHAPDPAALANCLQELSPAAHRVVLSPHGLSGAAAGPEQLFTLLSFLKPGAYEEMGDVMPHHITDPEQQVQHKGYGGWETVKSGIISQAARLRRSF